MVLNDFRPKWRDLLEDHHHISKLSRFSDAYYAYSVISKNTALIVPHIVFHIPAIRHMFAYSAVPSEPFFHILSIHWDVPHLISSLLLGFVRTRTSLKFDGIGISGLIWCLLERFSKVCSPRRADKIMSQIIEHQKMFAFDPWYKGFKSETFPHAFDAKTARVHLNTSPTCCELQPHGHRFPAARTAMTRHSTFLDGAGAAYPTVSCACIS